MSDYLAVQLPQGMRMVQLESGRVTIGRGTENSLALPDDRRVSRLHASLEDYGSGWSIRDLGSRNGTYVNGSRLLAEQGLRPGDEIRVGDTVLRYQSSRSLAEASETLMDQAQPPLLTRREREVLVVLCRAALRGEVFAEPASVSEIAAELSVTPDAVKQHLIHLYDKFHLVEGQGRRRVLLAHEAISRGMLSRRELHDG
jgi:pSer/pThr/pTyr-binding forkhead associated (FHA) protein